MITIEQKLELLQNLRNLWMNNPEQRFCQLLENILLQHNAQRAGKDIFYVTDEWLFAALKGYGT